MGAASVGEPAPARTRALERNRSATLAEVAWIAAVPVTLLALAAILLLAPPLGRLLFPPRHYDFWPSLGSIIRPEPTEHTSYLLALGAALLLSGCVALAALRPPRLAGSALRRLTRTSQLLLCGALVAATLLQRYVVYGHRYTLGPSIHQPYFTLPTLAAAALLAALAVAVLRRGALVARLAAALRETRGRRVAALVLAVLFVAVWLLTAVNVDSSVGNVNPGITDMLTWSFDETFAILDGRTPLATFHAQYGQLWPYLVAATMRVLGTGLGVYTTTMAAIGGAALLAVFGVFRRLVRSSLGALLLFAPFVATSFFMERGPLDDRYGPANLLTIFPVRYAGPYLLAWLLARRLDRSGAPRRAWPLFLAGALVALNNPEFGVPALAATLAACLWTSPPRTRRAAARLAGSVAAGVLAAAALVALVTLVRSGSLPRFGLLFEFSKLYGLSGWAMLPMPHVGLHLVIFATFAAALTLGTVRALSRDEDRLTTGMLVWSAIFGLGAGAYYVGRSHPEVLVDLFSAWAFTLVLLVVVAVRAIAARPSRRPTAIELAVLFGFGLAICSIAQTPTPWGQLHRLQRATSFPAYRDNPLEQFVAARTHRGEHVAILDRGGHRLAYDVGLVNVSPYSSSEAIVTDHQLATTVRALRAAHGSKVFLSIADTELGLTRRLLLDGFRVSGHGEPTSQTIELVDRRGTSIG